MSNANPIDHISGIVNLFKPKGETSRATLNRLQRAVRTQHRQQGKPPRVGHAGTLDPLAEGVLVACIGEATKLIEVIQLLPKCYTGTFQLGVTSDTEDVEGTIVPLPNPPQPTHDELNEATSRFVGRIMQRPPAYSALKIAGKRAYQLARQGEQVELPAREIEVYRIELVAYKYPIFTVQIECGSGTYIRSLGRDLAESVGTGAIMTALTRESIGPFTLANAVSPDLFHDLHNEDWLEHVLPLELGVAHLPRIDLDAKITARILKGQAVRKDEIVIHHEVHEDHEGVLENNKNLRALRDLRGEKTASKDKNLYAAFSPENQLVSLLELDDNDDVRIRKNFNLAITKQLR
jgi:tRNA pseudouridine55 synthase